VPLDESMLGAPSPEPRQVFGIGLNYASHAAESGAELPAIPAVFTKYPASLGGPFDPIELSGEMVDWEVELVVVIGRRADRIPEADAWQHVAGLCVGQDVSDRHVQFAAGVQFSLGKSFRTFGPTGPWLVTPDELDDPDDLGLGCSVDGETVQDDRTSGLVFGVPRLIAEISAVVPMLPGDLIFTGTPAGVGMTRQPPRFLRAGEVVESWIEGIGTIRNEVVTAPR
jgi:2-keto-4-pentenoate hydratase/2-oxohepta-3-ene-1,7-dioic acid hydratase in catechol pathway